MPEAAGLAAAAGLRITAFIEPARYDPESYIAAPDLRRRPGDQGFLGIMEGLGAEAAAHIGGYDAQFMLRYLQHEGAHQQTDHMRNLGGGVEGVILG